MRALFRGDGDLRDRIHHLENEVRQHVKSLTKRKLLETPEAELVGDAEDLFRIEPPELSDRKQWDDPKVSESGNAIYKIPFEGDGAVFDLTPAQVGAQLPRGDVQGSKLVISVPAGNFDPEEIEQRLQRQLDLVDGYLKSCSQQCAAWNTRLKQLATIALQERKAQLTDQSELAEKLRSRLKDDQ